MMNESQIQMGIDRINKKMYRTRSEKERLEGLEYQLQQLGQEKHALQQEYLSQQQTGSLKVWVELTALKDLLNELRLSNERKTRKASMIRAAAAERRTVRVEAPICNFQTLSLAKTKNIQTLLFIDKLTEIEQNSQEGLEYMLAQLKRDLAVSKKKGDRLAWYKTLQDRNLGRILHSRTQVRFKKVR